MASLYRHLLGARYARLPATVQRLHDRRGTQRLLGEVVVERGHGLLSRLMGAATLLPPAGDGPIEVTIEADGTREVWTRRVGGHAMRSRLDAHRGLLRERLGLVTFSFELRVESDDGAAVVRWTVRRVRALGVPLPAAWFAGVRATESERDGRYCFDVHAQLPGVGLLVHYAGALDVG